MDEILANLEKQSRQQLRFTKLLCVFCALMLVCALVLTISLSGAVKQILAMAEPLQALATQAETVIANLDTVAQDLANADLGAMVENINSLTADSQLAVTEALSTLDSIDIEVLNQAITDLASVVEPLAKFAKLFG